MRKWLLVLILLMTPCYAVEDYYQFSSPTARERFETLTNGLRCLVCQNQTIAESNAGLAVDLRGKVYQKIQEGQSDQQILQYLTERYGNYILYRPPFSLQTLGLWATPFLFLIIGLGYLFYYIRRSKS